MPAVDTESLPRRAANGRLARLLDGHDRLGSLCDLLEAIADDLPRACPERCGRAAAELEATVPAHHAFERDVLALSAVRSDLSDRILRHHAEDEGLAFEIVAVLEPLRDGAPVVAAETLGYMLRCFFYSCRRSMLIAELAIRADASPQASQPSGSCARATMKIYP